VDSGHPWVFSSDVVGRGGASAGDVIIVADSQGRTLGTAHYSSSSQICLRLLSDQPEQVDRSFWNARLEAAGALRNRVVSATNAYRLVHGEGDRLPGLIIDRYSDYFVLQTLDQGMDRAKSEILACLQQAFSPLGVLARNDVSVRAKEMLPQEASLLSGEVPDRIPIRVNDLRFSIDPFHGQKTGFFLDQRENYVAATRYAHGRALDCFTYNGGFAIHIAAKCESVQGVDSSEDALRRAAGNRAENRITNIEFRQADVFDLLAGYAAGGREFETIVLDPPAFSKSRSGLSGAARGYKEINLRALQLLKPGGILVTCSCSHHLSEAMLLEIVAAASLDAGKALRVLERRTQSQDHPILLTVPETHYLKCLILEVI
jgi:23S rRNA (cytosine1962-C5)-methyltransferase